MKNYFLLLFIFCTYYAIGQDVFTESNGTIQTAYLAVGGNSYYETCNATFINRSNSYNGNYRNNENYHVTICPTNHDPHKKVVVNFSRFHLESGYDYLEVYDESRTQAVPDGSTPPSSRRIGRYTGTNSPGTIRSTRGCLTFRFTSDRYEVRSGWKASVRCENSGGGGGGYCTAQTISCGTTYNGNTQYGFNDRSRYDCSSGYTWEGREMVYKISTSQYGTIKATLTTSSSLDLDIFIQKDCYSNCVARNINPPGTGPSVVRYNNAAPGDYYIVIDGQYASTYGAFSLRVECETGGGGGGGGYCQVSDDFDGYYNGAYVSSSNPSVWKKWSSSAPDGRVSRDRSYSSNQSMEINRGQYGAQDVVLKLGNRSHGIYKVTWRMYINNNDEAYFNVQNSSNYLQSGGVFGIKFENTDYHLHNKWIKVELFVDLNANRLRLYWDNRRYQVDRSYHYNLGGINFYATSDAHFYVDNICMEEVSYIPLVEEDRASDSRSREETTSVITTSVKDKIVANTTLKAFPNPTKGLTTVTLNLEQEEAITLSVFNQTGQLVKQLSLGVQPMINETLDLSDLPNGMYLVQLQGTTTNVHQKVLVQK